MLIIVTGVSGTGKTTIGTLISKELNIPFFDADDFHPKSNIEKMSQGHPLNDTDRKPWLEILAAKMKEAEGTGGAVLGCSALKEEYRKTLQVNPDLKWVHLKGDREVIWERMLARKNHYMKAEMLDSQFATWEEPDYGIKLSIADSPQRMLQMAMAFILEEDTPILKDSSDPA